MNSLKQIEQAKQQLILTIGRYVFDHPHESFETVAGLFGVSGASVSRYARKTGLGPRKRGRKPSNRANTEY